VGLAVILVGAACAERSEPTASVGTPTPTATVNAGATSLPPQPSTAAPRETPTPADESVVRALTAFARAPGAGTLAAVPFADRVRLGLSDRLMTERASVDLVRPDAWVLQQVAFRGGVGPYSALDLLAKSGSTIISVGPHPHCASPPVPPPADLVGSRRVSVQPTGIDTCLLWWTVDLFVSPAGQIEAVTLDLWDP
jgi:hypothetical protein